jgi:hypothetical protein
MMIDFPGGAFPLMLIKQGVALRHGRSGKLKAVAVSSL